MSVSLGEKLRSAREQRGISISEVAEQTRISPLYLEAIDADNYKTLPGGIFNKGFVRSYAKYVGIDEQEALQDYSRLVAENEPVEEERTKSYRPEVLTDDRSVSSMVPTLIFAAVILGLMTAGVLFLVNYIQNQQTDPTVSTNLAKTPAANVDSDVPANTAPTQTASQTPVMANLRVEFTAVGDAVSLTSVVDNGKGSEVLLAPGNPVVFEPKESLRLRYSKSRAEFAQLKLNGKQISLPSQPANPKSGTIEIEINQANLSQVWENGTYTFAGLPPAETNTATPAAASKPAPKPAANVTKPPTASNTNTTAAPAVPTMTGRPPAKPAATPGAPKPAANGAG